jgi:hypothetical protein
MPVVFDRILREEGGFILQENGEFVLTEDQSASTITIDYRNMARVDASNRKILIPRR